MKHLTILTLLITLSFQSCQNESTPESIIKEFINLIASRDCGDAKNLTTGEAMIYVESLIETGCTIFESNLKFVNCETSEETAKCDCEEERGGIAIDFIYYFKKIDGEWLISAIEGSSEPEDIAYSFVQFLAAGQCEKAKSMTLGSATTYVDEIISYGCSSYPSFINSIVSNTLKETATCTLHEDRDKDDFSMRFEFVKGGLYGWHISNVESGQSPDGIVRKFVTALANGDCDKASKLSTSNAKENIQAIIDSGCDTYEIEIVSVDCAVDGNSAECSSYELRDRMDMYYNYELKKVDGKWLISSFEKDSSYDDMFDDDFSLDD